MRIWTLSDLHVDYRENYRWATQVSDYDYQDDLLILAGDISDALKLFESTLTGLRRKFHTLFFLPGNHDLWTKRHGHGTSLERFHELQKLAADCGVLTRAAKIGATWFVPLLGWYDYSFGPPSMELKLIWRDFRQCKWPQGFTQRRITDYFTALNQPLPSMGDGKIITFSHFLPRIDLIPDFVPRSVKTLFPAMGTTILEQQLRMLGPAIHIYGHSHFNRDIDIDGIRYINNAFGYPHETRITRKELLYLGDA